MATSPQRRDPEEPRRAPEPVAGNFTRVEREVGTGRPFSWVWIWIPIVIAAFWFVGWGWGPYGGWWWGHGSESATQSANSTAPTPPNTNAQPANGALAGGTGATAANTPANGGTNNAQAGNTTNAPGVGPAAPPAAIRGTGVAVLDAQDKASYVGQPFQVQNIPIQKKASDSALWIGASNTNNAPPMLLVLPKGAHVSTALGDRLDVTGKVVKAPPASQAEHQWSISGDDAQHMDRQGVYIQGTSVQPAQP